MKWRLIEVDYAFKIPASYVGFWKTIVIRLSQNWIVS